MKFKIFISNEARDYWDFNPLDAEKWKEIRQINSEKELKKYYNNQNIDDIMKEILPYDDVDTLQEILDFCITENNIDIY